MSKYDPLLHVLLARDGSSWRVRFKDIEKILGMPLPASARKYPAWWSNDQTSHSHTRAWMQAGWKTEQVDIPGEALTFRKMKSEKSAPAANGAAPAQEQAVLRLDSVPSSVMRVLKRRALARGSTVEREALAMLVQAVEKGDRKTRAASIRDMTPKGRRFDLAALVRKERAAR